MKRSRSCYHREERDHHAVLKGLHTAASHCFIISNQRLTKQGIQTALNCHLESSQPKTGPCRCMSRSPHKNCLPSSDPMFSLGVRSTSKWCGVTLVVSLGKDISRKPTGIGQAARKQVLNAVFIPSMQADTDSYAGIKISWVKLPEYIQQLHCFTRGLQEVRNTQLVRNRPRFEMFSPRGSSS